MTMMIRVLQEDRPVLDLLANTLYFYFEIRVEYNPQLFISSIVNGEEGLLLIAFFRDNGKADAIDIKEIEVHNFLKRWEAVVGYDDNGVVSGIAVGVIV